MQIRTALQVESGFYDEQGVYLIDDTLNNEARYTTYRDRKDALSKAIDNFYANTKFCPNDSIKKDYDNRRLAAKNEGTPLFVSNEGAIQEASVAPEKLFNFYRGEIENYSIFYLTRYDPYFGTTRTIFLTFLFEILGTLTLSFFLFYFVFPFFVFKKGRQTLGKKVFSLGFVTRKGFSPSKKATFLRFLFLYFIYLILDFFSFLLVFVVSCTMLFLSRRNENLADYVLGMTLIDCSEDDIYLDMGDYLNAKTKAKSASIENRDFELQGFRR